MQRSTWGAIRGMVQQTIRRRILAFGRRQSTKFTNTLHYEKIKMNELYSTLTRQIGAVKHKKYEQNWQAYVVKDSPQPHCPFELGLMKTNSDLLKP